MRINSSFAVVSLLILTGLLIGGVFLTLWPNKSGPIFYQSRDKVWSHRSLSDGLPENSIAGAKRAFELGSPVHHK